MAKQNPSVRLVQSHESSSVKEELDAIEAEILRGISLLQVITRGVDQDDAELQVALEIATKHLDQAHNRMDAALMRLGKQ